MKVERKCKIVSKEQMGDAVYMVLEAGDMVRTSFRAPGQFVHVKCGEGLLLRRPISVCTCYSDEPSDLLTVVFEVRGEGTDWLARRPVGHSLDVLGLAGNGFTMKPEGPLSAGGRPASGSLPCWAAPVHPGKVHRHPGRPLRRQDHPAKLLPGRVRQSADRHRRRLSGPSRLCGRPGPPGAGGDQNYDAVLACGPRPMLRNVARVAEEFGVPCQVSMEERMGCGVGACLVCACDMADGSRKHVCKDGPVFDSREVNWDV